MTKTPGLPGVMSQLLNDFIVKDEDMHIYPPNDEKDQ